MAGRWDILDLYSLPHRYAEVYSFLYALEFSNGAEPYGFREIFQRYPWRGGYSAVNFYDDLYQAIPSAERPTIKQIRYASPGFIDVVLYLSIGLAIGRMVVRFAKQFEEIEEIYHRAYKHLQERRLLSLDVKEKERKLEKDEIKLIRESYHSLADALGFKKTNALQKLCADDLGAIKTLFAFYRRLRELARFQLDGKVKFSESDENEDPPKA